MDETIKYFRALWSISFDSLPPALEPYESAGEEQTVEEDCRQSDDVTDNAMESNTMPGDWLVFDSVYGVIPHETAELWKEQAYQAERKRAEAGNRPLPPVRFGHSQNKTAL